MRVFVCVHKYILLPRLFCDKALEHVNRSLLCVNTSLLCVTHKHTNVDSYHVSFVRGLFFVFI